MSSARFDLLAWGMAPLSSVRLQLLPLLMIVALSIATPKVHAQTATLLFSGGEDIDFVCFSMVPCGNANTNSGSYRSAWARQSREVGRSTTSDPPPVRFATSTFLANSTVWIHAQFCVSYGYCYENATSTDSQMLRAVNSNGNPTLIIRGTGNSGEVKISSRTSAGAFTDLVTCPSAFASALTKIDLKIVYGVSGEVTLYSDGAQVCDYTGNVTNGDGATMINQVEFATPVNAAPYSASWSEIIVATTDTRAMARFTANTVNNGATTGFSGTNVCSAIWNAVTSNDANYGYSGTSNVSHECTINSSVPPGLYTVLGLGMSARALVGASGPQHFDFLTRVAGTDYTSSDYAPTTSFMNFINYLQTVNPATGNPWSMSDFQSAGFNVGLETKP